jgi:hypothetical protein
MLNLQVTAADLRVGQGYVRCGRCDRVFNSLLSLADELPEDDQTNGVAVGTLSLPALPEDGGTPDADALKIDDAPAAYDLALDDDLPPPPPPPRTTPRPAEPDPARPPPGSSQITATLSGEDAIIEEGPTGTFETIVLEGDSFLQTEEHVEEAEVDARLQELVRRFDLGGPPEQDTWRGDGADTPPVALRPSAEAAATPRATDGDAGPGADDGADPRADDGWRPEPLDIGAPPAGDTATAADLAPFPGQADPPRSAADRGFLAGSVALALLLLAQVVHHFRVPLSAAPGVGALIAPLYGALGAPISRPPDLRAYEVRQLGGEPSATQVARIIVRASVRNRASYGQPAPLLRVTLQDRFGKRIAGRDVAPGEYLRGNAVATLGPDQRVDAEVMMEDPASSAVGFEIDACLPDAGGVVRCASDPRAGAAAP